MFKEGAKWEVKVVEMSMLEATPLPANSISGLLSDSCEDMKQKEADNQQQNVVGVKSTDDSCRDKIGTTLTDPAMENKLRKNMLKQCA